VTLYKCHAFTFTFICAADRSRGYWKVERQVLSKVRPLSLSVSEDRLLVVEKRRLTLLDVGTAKPKPKVTELPGNLEASHALETPCKTFVVCGRIQEKPGVAQVSDRK